MAKGRISRQPSPYTGWAFHGVRILQTISALAVIGMLSFFIHHLSIEYYQIPWTFILLLGVSCFSVTFIIVSITFYHQRSLKPKLSAFINAFITIIWAVGFSLLVKFLAPLLGAQCTLANWEHDAAVMVCQIYKALTAFSAIGVATAFAAFVIDIRTHRRSTRLGPYNPMADTKLAFQANRSTEALNESYREPSLEFPEYSHEAKKPYKPQRPIEAQNFGYQAPTEQTSYGGAHGELGERGGAYAGAGYGNGGGV